MRYLFVYVSSLFNIIRFLMWFSFRFLYNSPKQGSGCVHLKFEFSMNLKVIGINWVPRSHIWTNRKEGNIRITLSSTMGTADLKSICPSPDSLLSKWTLTHDCRGRFFVAWAAFASSAFKALLAVLWKIHITVPEHPVAHCGRKLLESLHIPVHTPMCSPFGTSAIESYAC